MSHLVKQSQLKEILEHSWRQTKDRYDGAFVDAEIPTTDKQITFTKVNNTKKNVSLADYARLQDKNNFKQDVSADNVGIANNKYMGSAISFDSRDRSLGFRQLTTSAFVDGYVDHIKVYVDNTNNAATSTWKVWAITKGANGKESDRVGRVIYPTKSLKVNTITENATEKKFVIIPIKESFANETYFIVKCSTHKLEVTQSIKVEHQEDVVNLNNSQPPDEANSVINWAANAKSNTAIMYLYGRESIGSLSEKIDAVKSGQVLSVNTQRPDANGNITIGISNIPNLQEELDKKVPKTDLVATGGTAAEQNKVPKLDANGKLHTSFIPEIAITRVKTAANEEEAKRLIGEGEDHLQTGDVVVLENTKKAYMYKGNNTSNFANDFLELTMGNGTVKSVSGGTPDANGNVVVGVVEGGATGITMSFGNGGTPVTVATYMTAQEVTEIKNLFV